ncbi:MAG: hypothetical protein HGA45_02845 [Chloroflexales bacterium]|nr:hypothetical protein [Chloroflexales bacterium]
MSFGEQPDGFETPYKIPHFVLTHTARPPVTNSGVTFSFVPTVEQILAEAQAAAGEKAACIAGGAQTAQQFMNAGLVDEINIRLVSRLLGDGLRLFDQMPPLALERAGARVPGGYPPPVSRPEVLSGPLAPSHC